MKKLMQRAGILFLIFIAANRGVLCRRQEECEAGGYRIFVHGRARFAGGVYRVSGRGDQRTSWVSSGYGKQDCQGFDFYSCRQTEV